jgi:parallel beta-helix repeat protein
VIVLVVECGFRSCNGNVSSVTDSNGLSYTLRLAYGPNDKLWEYYAIAPEPLSSDNITVAVSGFLVGWMVFAVKGVNTASVFDISPSLPATISCPGAPGRNDCTVSAETSAVDFVIASTAINDAYACTASTGFTEVTPAGGSLDIDYQIVDALGSKTYFTCSGTDPTAIVMDALVSSDSRPHTPIFIDGNDGFTASNGVTGGTGTSDDPYLIGGWTILAQSYGVEIANTTAYFTITGVTISGGGDGIVLSSIQNGVVQNSHISVYGDAVQVDNSGNFRITTDNIYSGNGHGIFLDMSSSFDVSYNNLGGGPFAITGSYVSDASIIGNTGGGEDGINLDHLSGLLISQNNIQAHTPIAVSSCGDLTIENNALYSPNAGIIVSHCNNVLVLNNTANVSGGEEGIWVTGSDSINITANTLSHNTNGIRLSNFATGNTITGNLISNNQCGIQADSTSTVDQNYVADNTFAGNTQDYCSL